MFCILFNEGKLCFKHLLHVLRLVVYLYTKTLMFGSNLTET